MMQVIYHSTAIVKWDNTKIILNTGGYRTVTTKKKMIQTSRQFDLGYSVFQKDFDWFIDFKGEVIPFDSNTITLER